MNWNEYFRQIAHTVKLKSKDINTQIGAGLAGGDWNKIEKILETVSNKWNKTFRVYIWNNKYPVAPTKPDFSKWKEMLDS